MKRDPDQIKNLARRLTRQRCYQEIDIEVTLETVETVFAIIRQYEDENWLRFVEEAEQILES